MKADKTSNLYKLTKEEYDQLLLNNITKMYKKANDKVVNQINNEAKEIADELELSDRINQLAGKNAYLTLKDHKKKFNSNPSCRLINPTKSEIGKVSKIILERANKIIKMKLGVMQWTDPQQVINWFKSIEEKHNMEFIKFDVKEFYPSITEELLEKSIRFGQKHCEMNEKDIKIVYNAAQSVLYHNEQVWVKRKEGINPTFDITMGGYHGAEVCELVGLFMLSEMGKFIPKENVGLYRDDGLMLIKKQ